MHALTSMKRFEKGTSMINSKFFCVIMLAITVALGPRVAAQVQTEVPSAVPGAKPVTIERIKVHGPTRFSDSNPHCLAQGLRGQTPSRHPDRCLTCICLILLRRTWSKLDVQVVVGV
jgi:hypothetical protein